MNAVIRQPSGVADRSAEVSRVILRAHAKGDLEHGWTSGGHRYRRSITRDTSGPLRTTKFKTKGRFNRPFGVLGLQTIWLRDSTTQEAPMRSP